MTFGRGNCCARKETLYAEVGLADERLSDPSKRPATD
jgi:hypothetical protein